MSKPQTFKRIIVEDYDQKDRNLISKLAYSINVFADDIINILNKNVSMDNLSSVQKTITVAVDANGKPTTTTTVASGLSSLCTGISVIRAINTTNPSILPKSQPFITFIDNSGAISIQNISGLTANNTYTLTIIMYPS